MTLPTISKPIIEKAKTAVLFALVVFAIGFAAGIHYAHTQRNAIDVAVQHATTAAATQSKQ